MHRAQNAYTELLSTLNTSPRMVCLLQEPYLVRDQLPRRRGLNVFPSTYTGLRTAIYSPRFLKGQETFVTGTALLYSYTAARVMLLSPAFNWASTSQSTPPGLTISSIMQTNTRLGLFWRWTLMPTALSMAQTKTHGARNLRISSSAKDSMLRMWVMSPRFRLPYANLTSM